MDFPNVFPESFPMVCVASFPRHGGEIEGGCGLGRWEGKIPGSIGWELRLGFWFGDVGGYFCWCSMDFHHGNLIVLRCSMDFHQFSRFPGFLFQDFLGEIWKSTCVCVSVCVCGLSSRHMGLDQATRTAWRARTGTAKHRNFDLQGCSSKCPAQGFMTREHTITQRNALNN